jgi:hypothetical protein
MDESDPAIQAILDARNTLSDAENPSDKYDANQRLTEAYTDLSEKLQTMNLSKADEKYRAGLVDELNSRNDTISHDGYNKKAEEYNKLLNAFPANILSRLTGVKPLALFR